MAELRGICKNSPGGKNISPNSHYLYTYLNYQLRIDRYFLLLFKVMKILNKYLPGFVSSISLLTVC